MLILQQQRVLRPAGRNIMANAPSTEHLLIDGPAGPLEAMLDTPAAGGYAALAVVLHPHPEHGGTMQNKVTHTVARALTSLGFAALRFNFRGTGTSAGNYDEGVGEEQDAVAAVDWMRSRYPGQPLWLSGFSFGAAIAIRAAVEVRPAGLISVAPAVRRFASGMAAQPDCPWLVIQGDADEVVDVNETIEWVGSLEPRPELCVLPGVDHFFHGKLIALREAVTHFVISRLERAMPVT